jgi:hypothetical protein
MVLNHEKNVLVVQGRYIRIAGSSGRKARHECSEEYGKK